MTRRTVAVIGAGLAVAAGIGLASGLHSGHVAPAGDGGHGIIFVSLLPLYVVLLARLRGRKRCAKEVQNG